MRVNHDEQRKRLTMILAVSSDAETACFDSGKTQTDGFTESRGVDVRNSVLVTDPTVGKVEPLARDVAVWIRGIVGSKPEDE